MPSTPWGLPVWSDFGTESQSLLGSVCGGGGGEALRRVMSTHASILVDSVGPPSAEVCRTAASFP
jgi:hypothetical protein